MVGFHGLVSAKIRHRAVITWKFRISMCSDIEFVRSYRVTHQVVLKVLLTLKKKLRFGIMCTYRDRLNSFSQVACISARPCLGDA